MAARPRGQTGWVRPVGNSWVGYWQPYQRPGTKRPSRKQRVIGLVKKMNKTQARIEFRKWLDENINTLRELPLKPTLANIWDTYKRRYERRSVGHGRTMKSFWTKHIKPAFGEDLLDEIDHEDIENFFDGLVLGASGKRQIRFLLNTLMTYAIEEKVLEINPMHRAVLQIDSTADTDTLDIPEVRGLLLAMNGLDQLKFETAIFTGLSRSEFIALRPDDISIEGIRVDEKVFEGRVGRTKTLKRRDMAACPAEVRMRLITYAADRARIDDAGERCWLWPGERGDGPMDPDRFTKVLKAAAAKAGVKKEVDWRILRRTWATLALKDSDLGATAAQMRNNPATTAKNYVKATMDARQQAVDGVWAKITEQGRVN